ncbi:peptidoglycan recognition family protein [Streptomyces sp. AK08-01B]|uniref:peptidoglycan recognition protein family protein n=2 Tax=unclassified Streptomyces TaxID=2593676 RepID=UPI0029A64EC6|nr:peptidoglycan recognition family protein [Streptomyces sp. AK08-01B]MDX3767890.1 peptidoglycan recognition family protein [Streptomyces sp. AK08-01B]MDX3818117.1 peptidoglycan recognition family protein [Streptomyces sp. AK08-01A]
MSAHDECIAYWQRVRSFHMDQNGWVDIGYSFGACPHGELFTGRGLGHYQAAQGTTAGNSDYYSVTLMVGGLEVPSSRQITAVRALRDHLIDLGLSAEIRAHREFFDTECPGRVIDDLLRQGAFTSAHHSAFQARSPRPQDFFDAGCGGAGRGPNGMGDAGSAR